MSTKTILKRVSLVAVVALGVGMLSAIPSQAAPTFADVTVYSAGTQIVGGQATISITTDTTTTNVAVTGVGSIVSVSGGINTTPSGGAFIITNTGVTTLVLTSAVVGTTTITATPISSVDGSPMTPVTKTITWISGAPNTVLNHSTAYINSLNASATLASDTAVGVTPISVVAAAGTFAAELTVTQYSSTDTSLLTAAGSTAAVTVSISGAGAVSSVTGGGSTGPSVTVAAGTSNPVNFWVYGNGVAGVGTITISVGGVVVATKTVTFVGTLASYKLTPANTVTAIGGLADVVTVSPLDSNGNAAALGTYYVTSSNPAVASVPSAGQTGTTFSVTGLTVGTSTITVANAAGTILKTYTVTVGKGIIHTLTLTTDATSYAAGAKVTLTVKALGSDGLAVGDGVYANTFTTGGVTSNLLINAPLPGASVTFAGGVATYVIYAPATDGTVTLTGTEGTSTDATVVTTVSTSFDVANAGSSAAVDAANAATDAANYAADAADAATTAAQEATAAAQAAQDSADAATAAVVALGLRVNTLIASVRAQLTSLSNLLVRIIKATHA